MFSWSIAGRLAALLLTLLISLAACQPSAPQTRPDTFGLHYSFSNGSLPPPYHYEFDLVVEADGSGTLTIQPGYSPEDHPPVSREFNLSAEQMDDLYAALAEQGAFSRRWEEESDPPVGGSYESLTVTLDDGRSVTVPAYPVGAANQQVAEEIFSAVRALPGQALWAELNAVQAAFEQQAVNQD